MSKQAKVTDFFRMLMLIALVLAILPVTTFAKDTSVQKDFEGTILKSHVDMNGNKVDGLKIEFDNDRFFYAPIMNPGDTFTSKITISNTSDKEIEYKFTSIKNAISDDSLYKVLELVIKSDGEVIYKGKLSDTGENIIDWFKLTAGNKKNLDISIYFPSECGNEYQGKEMKTNWLFEARIPDKEATVENKPKEEPKKGNEKGYSEPDRQHKGVSGKENEINNPKYSRNHNQYSQGGDIGVYEKADRGDYAIFMLAGIVVILFFVMRKKKETASSAGVDRSKNN